MNLNNFINDYLKRGMLQKQKPQALAVQKLVARALKDIKAAKANMSIDCEIAFSVAYLAMLHAGRGLMLHAGYRPDDGAQHKTVVEFAHYYLGKTAEPLVIYFDRMRRKRNIFTYEVGIAISRTEAQNAIEAAEKFVAMVKSAIQKDSPQGHFDL